MESLEDRHPIDIWVRGIYPLSLVSTLLWKSSLLKEWWVPCLASHTMEFLVIGRYPLSMVRTMPVKYSLLVEWFVPWPVESSTNPSYEMWTLKQGLLQAKDLHCLSPKIPLDCTGSVQARPLKEVTIRQGLHHSREVYCLSPKSPISSPPK